MPPPLPRSSWFSCPQPDATAPARLWCLPFAGGGTIAWFPYRSNFTGLAELVAVRPPGRENRVSEPPFQSFEPLAEAVTRALVPHVRAADVLCGHSLGALLAFEAARRLPALGGAAPRALIASGMRAPHLPRREADITHLNDDAFLLEVDERYRALPPEVRDHPELRELALPVLRGDMAAYEKYQYRPAEPLSLPILALNSDDDPTVNPAEAAGWSQHTTAAFESATVAGAGHMFVLTEVPWVTRHIRSFLERLPE